MKKLLCTTLLFILSFIYLYAPHCATIMVFEIQPIVKGFVHYADDLGYKESGNDITIVNKIGCFGEHQWKQSTLHYLGYKDITLSKFKRNPAIFPKDMQRQALRALVDSTINDLKLYTCYIGTTIDSVVITKSGLIAAAHLGGTRSVKKYLLSRGTYILIDGRRIEIKSVKNQKKYNSKDIFGTSISDYIKQFSYYNI